MLTKVATAWILIFNKSFCFHFWFQTQAFSKLVTTKYLNVFAFVAVVTAWVSCGNRPAVKHYGDKTIGLRAKLSVYVPNYRFMCKTIGLCETRSQS